MPAIRPREVNKLIQRLVFACVPFIAAACGGGGSAPGSGPILASGSPVVEMGDGCTQPGCPRAEFIEQAGSGALGEHQYSGQGTGLWHYQNASDTEVNLPVSISGVDASSTVSLVYANEDTVSHAFSPGRQPASLGAPPMIAPPPEEPPREEHCRETETAWRFPGAYVDARSGKETPVAYTHCATEVLSVRASDGRKISFWVEYSVLDDTRINRSLVAAIARRFVTATPNAYDLLTQVTGPLWGAHRQPRYIAGDASNAPDALQPLNIVFIDPRGRHAERFASLFVPANIDNQHWFNGEQISARRLSVYLNADAVLNDGNAEDGRTPSRPSDPQIAETVKSMLAHELVHLANFYHRVVLPPTPAPFEDWLEELSAIQVGHIVDASLGELRNSDTGDVYWRDDAKARIAGWRRARGQCGLFTSDLAGACHPHDVTGALGIYLAHQYGPAVYRNLLAATDAAHDSVGLLDAAIRAAGGVSLTDSLWRHGVALATQPGVELPAGFGFPKWFESSDNAMKIRLSAIDAGALPELPLVVTPAAATPDSVLPYGFIPVVRPASGDRYEEVLSLPPHSSVTVLIQKK